MATQAQLFARYSDFIATELLKKYGGSYQTTQTFSKLWRQQLEYHQSVEDFILATTRVFLLMLPTDTRHNMNLMYTLCYNIADYLSKYTAKKSQEITRKEAATQILEQTFFKLSTPVFKRIYKKPVNTDNPNYVNSNPGIIAMLEHLNSQQH